MSKTALVFCSSSAEVAPIYFSEIELLGRGLAERGIRLVYGGARVGLMGHLANSALKHGGFVTGVIPEYLNQKDIVHEGLSELIVVNSLMDRKRRMLELCDVAVAAPGGIGTLDEVTEAIALKQLNEVVRPIVFHNFLDFWSPLLTYFEELRNKNMISQPLEDLYKVCEDGKSVLESIELK